MADAREPEQGAGSQEPPRDQESPAGEDLFDRWLAHRADGESAPRPRTYGVPRTGVHRPHDEREDDTTAEAPAQDTVGEPIAAPAEDTLDAPVEERAAPAPAPSHESPLDPRAADEPGEALVDAPATPLMLDLPTDEETGEEAA